MLDRPREPPVTIPSFESYGRAVPGEDAISVFASDMLDGDGLLRGRL
jgi:hypothetical protein